MACSCSLDERLKLPSLGPSEERLEAPQALQEERLEALDDEYPALDSLQDKLGALADCVVAEKYRTWTWLEATPD